MKENISKLKNYLATETVKFTLYLTEMLRRKIKVEAAALGMTMNDFILMAVENQINRMRED